MIVIRNVFRLKFGKAKEAVALMKEGLAIQKRVMAGQEFSPRPHGCHRALLHAGSGDHCPNLATFESNAPRMFADKEWQANYQKVVHSWNRAIVRCSRSSNSTVE